MLNTAPAQVTPTVSIINDQAVTTSKAIAEFFHKRHDNVLSAIRKRVIEAGEWGVLNFKETPYIDEQNGQTYSMFTVTKDGFTFLVQKFTGKKAVQYQIAYIEQFNIMERELKSQYEAKKTKPQKALPNGLTIEQRESIKALVKARVEACPKDKQAKAAITCWSALKSKFGCTYKEIEPDNYVDALSLVARVTLEGEWLPSESIEQQETKVNWPASRWLEESSPKVRKSMAMSGNSFLTISPKMLFGPDDESVSPTLRAISELERFGHNLEACRLEVLAMQYHLEGFYFLLENVRHLSEKADNRRGLQVKISPI